MLHDYIWTPKIHKQRLCANRQLIVKDHNSLYSNNKVVILSNRKGQATRDASFICF